MDDKKKNLVSSILFLVAALCFGIVAFAHFYMGHNSLGCLCLVATICDLISSYLNFKKYKNK